MKQFLEIQNGNIPFFCLINKKKEYLTEILKNN